MVWWLSLASTIILVSLGPGIWRYDIDAPFRSQVIWCIWLVCLPLSLFSLAGVADTLYRQQLSPWPKAGLIVLHIAAVSLALAPVVAFILVAASLPAAADLNSG
jgi:hypothetical protein